jgi:hypothetical protein
MTLPIVLALLLALGRATLGRGPVPCPIRSRPAARRRAPVCPHPAMSHGLPQAGRYPTLTG